MKLREIRVFDGEDFDLWKLELKACLMKHEIEDVLDPKMVPGINSTEKEMQVWRKQCNKALGLIILSLGDTQKRKVKDEKFPLGALNILEKEYESKSKANKFLLFRKLLALQWEPGTTLAQHLDTLDRTVDRVRAVGKEVDDDTICGVLINSLPAQYDNIVENFDILGETITLNKVREVLIQHKQTVKIREGEVGQIALHASAHKNSQKAAKPPATNNTNNTTQNNTTQKHCAHCKLNTHNTKHCWILFPEQRPPGRSSDKKAQAGSSTAGTKGKRVKEVFVAANSLSEGAADRWLLDSGASCHMSHDRDSFVSLRDHKVTIQIGKKGGNVVSEGVGDVDLCLDVCGETQHIRLTDVLYIPDLPVNLLSVAALTSRNLRVEFNKRDGCVVYNRNELIVAVAINTGNNTYSLQLRKETAAAAVLPSPAGSQVSTRPATDLVKWHNRLGHISTKRIQEMAGGLVDGMGKINFTQPIVDCKACALGKLKRKPISSQPASRALEPLELVHSDVCGPMEVAGTGGAKYFALVVDDATRYVFVLFLKEKSNLAGKLQALIAFLNVNKKRKIGAIRCDNGGEYTSAPVKEFCHKQGITLEYTAPNSPQQNGVAERKNGSIVTLARCMLQRAKLPKKYWVEAVAHAVYITNRAPTKAVIKQTPYEAWHKEKPDLRDLKTFGCDAVVLFEQGTHTKLEPKGRTCKFLGYRSEGEGFKFYDPKTGSILASRNVQFQELNTLEIGHSCPPDYEFSNTNTLSYFRDIQVPIKQEPKEEEVVVEPPLGLAPLLPTSTVVQRPPPVSPAPAAVSTAVAAHSPPHTPPHTPSHSQPPSPQHTPVQTPAPSASPAPAHTSASGPSGEIGTNSAQVSGSSGSAVSAQVSGSSGSAVSAQVSKSGTSGPQQNAENQGGRSSRYPKRDKKEVRPWWAGDGTNMYAILEHTALLAAAPDPTTRKQALASAESKKWIQAEQTEIASLEENKTWSLVPPPNNRKVIGVKWVYKKKRDAEGAVTKFKGRLVAKGFAQKKGFDFEETFAPVAKLNSIRSIIAMAAAKGLNVHQMDVDSAFLNGQIDCDIYMSQPPGYEDQAHPDWVCKLNKSLYGLKQAGRIWYEVVANFLVHEHQFIRSQYDPCVFVRENEEGAGQVTIGLYVDDFVYTGAIDALLKAKAELAAQFKVKDLGPAHHIVGLQVTQTETGIALSQSTYIRELIESTGLTDAHAVSCPMTLADLNSASEVSGEDAPCNITQYRQILGKLMWAMVGTRPDIAFAVGALGRFASAPSERHLKMARRVVCYLKATGNARIFYPRLPSDAESSLEGFADADWGGCHATRRSTTGYVFTLNGAPISWQSKRQQTVALSSTEAEYMAACHATKEVVWLRGLLGDLGLQLDTPTVVREDNKGCLDLAGNPRHHQRTKHIDIQYHFIREKIEEGVLELVQCPTDQQLGDIFTKPLVVDKHYKFAELLLEFCD